MPLTTIQQASADKLVAAFGDFMTSVGGPSPTPAPAPLPAPASLHPVDPRFDPTPQDYADFAAAVGLSVDDLHGTNAAQAAITAKDWGLQIPWPTIKAIANPTQEQMKDCAAFGYNSFTGRHHVSSKFMFDRWRHTALLLAAATTADQANWVLDGVSGADQMVAIIWVLVGGVGEYPTFGSPVYNGPSDWPGLMAALANPPWEQASAPVDPSKGGPGIVKP